MKPFTIDHIMAHNERAGLYFFSYDTMQFFKSTVGNTVYTSPDGKYAYFATGEKGLHTPRRFTVRVYNAATGDISTHGEFQAYQSLGGAVAAAKKAAQS